MKKIFIFILILIPWFLSSLVPIDKTFYDSLLLPFFTPPAIFFGIAWSITYFMIALSIYQILKHYNFNFKNIPSSYKKSLIIYKSSFLSEYYYIIKFYELI